jgi:ribosomal protein S18 acetylase RimI-like enzyme
MVTIRSYSPADYASVASLLEAVSMFDGVWDSEKNVSGMSDQNPDAVLVALMQEKIVGCVYCIPFGSQVVFIFRLAVLPHLQSQGIGSRLIDAAMARWQKKGVKEFGLFVDQDNSKLNDFYAKRGFSGSLKPWVYRYKDVSHI